MNNLTVQELLKQGFRFSKNPKYGKGEKYCARCELVCPPWYQYHLCPICNRLIRLAPKKGRFRRKLGVRYVDSNHLTNMPERNDPVTIPNRKEAAQ